MAIWSQALLPRLSVGTGGLALKEHSRCGDNGAKSPQPLSTANQVDWLAMTTPAATLECAHTLSAVSVPG